MSSTILPPSRSSTPPPPGPLSRSSTFTPSDLPSRSSTPPPPSPFSRSSTFAPSDSPSRSSTPPPPVPDEYEHLLPVPPYAAHNALLATDEDPYSGQRVPYTLPTLHPDETLPKFLEKELSVERINNIAPHLGISGSRRVEERPLHRQLMAGREIVIAETTDLHLCWEGKQLYLKPIPAFLLHHDFFTREICASSAEEVGIDLYASACGFLKSYTKLIRHESDLLIAKEKKLVPESVTWEKWCDFSADVVLSTRAMILSERYGYGELRLTKLNLLYEMHEREPFHLGDRRYKFLLNTISNEWLVFAFAYFTVVLAAIQAVLATQYGAGSVGVQMASFGFGMFVLAVVGASCVVMVLFMVLRAYVSLFTSETWLRRHQYKIYYLDRILEALGSVE